WPTCSEPPSDENGPLHSLTLHAKPQVKYRLSLTVKKKKKKIVCHSGQSRWEWRVYHQVQDSNLFSEILTDPPS
ncbi:hypothetical protein TorRG33x02_024990, partial [Trema orientale]